MFFLVIAKINFIADFWYSPKWGIAKINFIAKEYSRKILEQDQKKQ
jgi:hypothetical protein